MARWTGHLVVVAVLALALVGYVAPTASAATTGGRLEVVEQTPWVPAEGEFEVSLAWDGPVEGHVLRVRFFQRVDDEIDLEERTPAGPLNHLPPVPLSELGRDGEGNLVVRIPIRSLPLPAGDPSRIYLPAAGVYPLEFEITGPSGEEVTSLFTDLVRLPGDLAEVEPLAVAVVLPVGPSGLSVPEAIGLLSAAPSVPVTVVLDPLTLEQVAADSALVDELRQALGDREVVAANPVPIDVSALAEIGQLELYDEIRRSGAQRVAEVLGREVAADLVLADEVPTAAAAAHLAAADTILLSPVGTEGGVVDTRSGPLPVVSPDEALMRALGRATHDAYHVLARLAVRSGYDEPSPVVLTASPSLGVGPADLAVVVEALEQPGIVAAVPLPRIVAELTNELSPSERPRQDLRQTGPLLEQTLEDLREYESFHVSGPLPPAYLESRVLAALAVDVAPQRRRERLAAVRADINDALGVISLPEGRTVNLAATTSPLPLSVTSTASGPRRVRVTFSSDKLTFPGGDSRVVELDQGTTAFDFVVESRSFGVSPLDVVISTPDGSRELARTRITIRSTAVPGLGMLLSGAALVFLIGWWAVHVARGRREGAEASSLEPVA